MLDFDHIYLLGSTTSFDDAYVKRPHDDPRYGGDLHRADMAWAVHAAARGLSREQIEHEILKGRDLSKKGSAPRRLAYAMRTASKAIAQSAQ